ncbi:hypothetical protein N480_18595 [Pseudoalteromonas luteoviolacea S2607]|uniref:hypothetical protein n=1 Tax=Pseudoalteromonas luteoviolacea TaxID=43657 RepID=UPI0007B04EA3|nr:hypothetical protein [Pseudoalteromonas luteoviolacea]KZN36001.1 hypothetical protein N480_18595 [Pseudoalteromonas luteoviolacea S2607]
MKIVHLILITVIALVAFYIQVDNPVYSMQFYLSVLAFCFVLGVLNQEPNIWHISLLLTFIAVAEYSLFATGVIDLGQHDDNYLVIGTIVFGLQLLINILAVLLFVFRVQISRLFSSSSKIILTDFDGLFHWLFIAAGVVNVLALIENALRNVFGWHSLTFVYDTYEIYGYALMAIACGLLLTMLILKVKNKQLT